MERKPERQGPPKSPRQDKTRAPQIAAVDHSHTESSGRGLAKTKKRELRLQARRSYETDWLAPAGSEQERKFLRELVKQDGLGKEDRDLLAKWISNPNGSIDYNAPFWRVAKKLVLGPVLYERAMERHRNLRNNEWLVSYFTVQGIKQKEIAELTRMSEKTVDNIIRSLKDKISQEFQCEIEIVDRVQIARWFFGL